MLSEQTTDLNLEIPENLKPIDEKISLIIFNYFNSNYYNSEEKKKILNNEISKLLYNNILLKNIYTSLNKDNEKIKIILKSIFKQKKIKNKRRKRKRKI